MILWCNINLHVSFTNIFCEWGVTRIPLIWPCFLTKGVLQNWSFLRPIIHTSGHCILECPPPPGTSLPKFWIRILNLYLILCPDKQCMHGGQIFCASRYMYISAVFATHLEIVVVCETGTYIDYSTLYWPSCFAFVLYVHSPAYRKELRWQ